jgi:hypothetical protein
MFDLSWDPAERSDLARQQAEAANALESELRDRLEVSRIFNTGPADPALSPQAIEHLRSLGYIE